MMPVGPTFKLRHARFFELGVHQPWETLSDSGPDPPIASMICLHERKFLEYLTSRTYSGRGAVVDLGPLLGGSTYALLAGMKSGRVHAYDLWRYCSNWAGMVGEPLKVGADLLPYFLKNLGSYAERVAVHKGDLLDAQWSGGPIEILFIDAAKSPELMLHIADQFFPALLPGAYVMQQDWVSSTTPWIQIAMDLLSKYFEVMDSPEGGTVCFRVRCRIPRRALDREYFHTDIAEDCFQRAIDELPDWHGLCVRLGEAVYWMGRGDGTRAMTILQSVKSDSMYSDLRIGFDADFVEGLLAQQRVARIRQVI